VMLLTESLNVRLYTKTTLNEATRCRLGQTGPRPNEERPCDHFELDEVVGGRYRRIKCWVDRRKATRCPLMARNGHAEDLSNVRYWENIGRHVLALSFSGFDPDRTSGPNAVVS
jgi:hypothetical protein